MDELVLVLRNTKGAPLTHDEMDANFTAIKDFVDNLVGFAIDIDGLLSTLNNRLVGTSDDRRNLTDEFPPTIPFFDLDLNKPVWKSPDGEWVDANGNSVDAQDV